MKRSIIYLGLAFAAVSALSGAGAAHAQMMGSYSNGSSATGTYGYGMMGGWSYPGATSTQMSASDTQAIAEGQALYGQLQAKQISCSQLTEDNYDQLGEYFMQQVTGSGHAAMDAMIGSMMGEQGDIAMHVAWGERYSGCDANAALPGGWSTPGGNNNYYGMPMMGNYGNYGYGPYGMMGYGYGGSWLGWIFMILFWVLLVIGLIVLIRWLAHGGRHGWHDHGHTAIGVLKERYAKGEIDKKEYEEKKKDLEA